MAANRWLPTFSTVLSPYRYSLYRYPLALVAMSLLLCQMLCQTVRSLLEDTRNLQSEIAESSQAASSQVVQLQSQFQQIVAGLSESDFNPTVERRLRPLQTEGHRQLKLAGIAAMRLKTAKQPQTVAAMQSQVIEHLSQLQNFLESMASELCNL